MLKKTMIYILISLLFGIIFFYLTEKLVFSILVFIIYSMFFFIIFDPKYKYYQLIIKKTTECINFINNFIITLSINNSITATFDSLQNSFSNELIEQINAIGQLNDEDKIEYLENYFESPLYTAFVKLLKQYLYDGGNILDSSHLLIFDSRLIEENLNNFLSISKKKIFEFVLMWGICFFILIIIHIFLGNYYTIIQHMTYFPYSVFAFFIIFLICLGLILNHYVNLKFVNGDIKNEKHKKSHK